MAFQYYTPPIQNFIINERPRYQTQSIIVNGVYAGDTSSCVANATVACAEIMAIRRNKISTNISVSWMWGKIGINESEGALFADGVLTLINNGAPVVETVYNNIVDSPLSPDITWLSDAKLIYADNINTTAQANKASSSGIINVNDNYSQIFSDLQNSNKTVFMSLGVDISMDSPQAYTTGVVPAIGDSSGHRTTYGASTSIPGGQSRGGHTMAILGWKYMNNQYYWICQNSWTYTNGYPMGDYGLYYIPFDWRVDDYSTGMWSFYTITYGTSHPFTRPTNFQWTVPKVSNGEYNLKITEWLRFEQSMNWMRCYKNQVPLLLPRVFKDHIFTAVRFKQVLNGVNNIPGHGSLPVEAWSVVSGSVIKASYLNDIRDSLNNIT